MGLIHGQSTSFINQQNIDTGIVTDGLTVLLDASRTYNGGPIWFDFSGNGNHMTLFGTPTYSSSNGGILQFNGTNQYGTNLLNYSTTTYTIMAGSRYSGATRGRVISAVINNWLFGHWNSQANAYYAEGWITASSGLPNDTNWRIFSATENYATDQRSFYVNDVINVSNSTAGAAGFNGLGVGRYGPGNNEYSTCEISFILVYSRILTTNEMTQNYNVYKGRFGL